MPDTLIHAVTNVSVGKIEAFRLDPGLLKDWEPRLIGGHFESIFFSPAANGKLLMTTEL